MATPPQTPDPANADLPFRAAAVDRAAGELRRGRPVLVAGDDGLFWALAAELCEPRNLDFLKTQATGEGHLVLTHPRAETLKIRLYTPDVVALDWRELDADAIRALADPGEDLRHPLRGPFATARGQLPSAYAAAAKLAKVARLLPAVVVAPADQSALTGGALSVSTDAILAADATEAATLYEVTAARVPLAGAEVTRIHAFRPADGSLEHLAIVIGDPARPGPVLARLHSECFTGDLLGSMKCDCGEQLRGAIAQIAAEGSGILLYLAQEGRGIGLMNKLRAYRLQEQGFDTVESNERLGFMSDERLFAPAAQMLRLLGFSAVRLMTNNPDKIAGLEAQGIQVTERVAHAFPANDHNRFYLSTKARKSGHLL